jgi:hypothetical protein
MSRLVFLSIAIVPSIATLSLAERLDAPAQRHKH